MDSALRSALLAAALVGAAAAVACRAWHRWAESGFRRREEEAAAERDALLLAEQALRARLHDANEALHRRAE